jgi:hypothetical protein
MSNEVIKKSEIFQQLGNLEHSIIILDSKLNEFYAELKPIRDTSKFEAKYKKDREAYPKSEISCIIETNVNKLDSMSCILDDIISQIEL